MHTPVKINLISRSSCSIWPFQTFFLFFRILVTNIYSGQILVETPVFGLQPIVLPPLVNPYRSFFIPSLFAFFNLSSLIIFHLHSRNMIQQSNLPSSKLFHARVGKYRLQSVEIHIGMSLILLRLVYYM